MPFQKSRYEQSYTSFSGTDIRAYFGSAQVGTLQGISFNTTREVAPLYVMGWTNPRSFSRGKRAIAGSMVFTVFDKSALMQEINSQITEESFPHLNPQEARAHETFGLEVNVDTTALGVESASRAYGQYAGWKRPLRPFYPDQLPPFDVILTAHSEFGEVRVMTILGCMVLNNASGVSIDDIQIEESMTYVARDIHPWHDPSARSDV